jgi:putative Mg2+ transporter-C (MgtC) family protein
MIAVPQGSVTEILSAFRADLGLKLLVAVVAGGAVGLERQISGKPAGLRTNILICVGSALLMDLSVHIGEVWGNGPVGDPARLAAQVVTGIGFIGAGTIMQTGATITGLTSAATIWVVAAIGLTAGAGFFVEALGATATVMLVLAGLGRIEHSILRLQRTVSMTVRAKPGTEESVLRSGLADEGLSVVDLKSYDHATDRVFEMRVKGPSRQFDAARSCLLAKTEVMNVYID